MTKILIIGGGFAGISAASRFYKSGLDLDIILIDKKETADFLPMLPDCIGRGIDPAFLAYKIENIGKKLRFKFIREEVAAIDLDKRQIFTKTHVLTYDYLLISSGSETNFYENENIKQNALTLDSADDARKVINTLRQNEFDNFIIGGGGYTGVEVATNLRLYLSKSKRNSKIIIVERSPAILGFLPAWMKDYVLTNLKGLNIEVYLNNTIEKIEERSVYLGGNRVFDNALAIWTAGVTTAAFIKNLKLEKNPQGRIKVNEYLRLNDNCFVAGDAAFFAYKEFSLRMAVQFAIAEGEYAAVNIVNSIKRKRLRKFIPQDLGYIIPMANNQSCGSVLGFNLRGLSPTLLHFIMCIYRCYGMRNKFGIISRLLRP